MIAPVNTRAPRRGAFGTDDLLDLVVRPNRVQITADIYATKVERWRRVWPLLQILPREDGVGVAGIRRVL